MVLVGVQTDYFMTRESREGSCDKWRKFLRGNLEVRGERKAQFSEQLNTKERGETGGKC